MALAPSTLQLDIVQQRLQSYLAARLDLPNLQITRMDSMSGGLSNETYLLMVSLGKDLAPVQYIVRWDPGVGLLEPYDIPRQYRIMKALATTSVLVPKVYWLEEDESVIGAKFYIMGKLEGKAPGRVVDDEDPQLRRRKRESYVRMLANIHSVDWQGTGLGFMGTPAIPEVYALREIRKWENHWRRYRSREDWLILDAFTWLRANAPESKKIQLVHGDCSVSNYMFVDSEVVGVIDWEMANLGDPMADIGYYFGCIRLYAPKNERQALREEFIELYQGLTGRSFETIGFWEVFFLTYATAVFSTSERFTNLYLPYLEEYKEVLKQMMSGNHSYQ